MIPSPTTRSRRVRPGATLMELILASSAASVLLAGMASSIFVASQTLDMGDSDTVTRARDSRAVNRMLDNVREALAFTERTSTAIAFTVPDRSGDGAPETLRYAWSGVAGDPLTFESNGSAPTAFVRDVRSLDFAATTRTIPPAEVVVDNGAAVVYEEFTETFVSSVATAVAVDTPDDTEAGDLLILVAVIDGDVSGTVANPSGWEAIHTGTTSGAVTLGVWWKLADASEPAVHLVAWTGSSDEKAYAFLMRFTGHHPTDPIHVTASANGSSNSPRCPAITTTAHDCMILRVGGFDDDDISIDYTGMAGHTTITMDESNDGGGTVSAGAAYAAQGNPRAAPTPSFTLTRNEQYRTVTIAIAPDTDS